MSSNSQYLLETQTHPRDSTTETVTGNAVKGDGYYGRSDGLHTVQYTFTGLTGTIQIQATLELEPTDSDWFAVHEYTASQETASKIASFTGNYVWIRANLFYTDGTLESISLNH